MVTLNLQVGIDLEFVCAQCRAAMQLKPPTDPRLMATLKCPTCGFQIDVKPGMPRPATTGLQQRMPKFRPAPKA